QGDLGERDADDGCDLLPVDGLVRIRDSGQSAGSTLRTYSAEDRPSGCPALRHALPGLSAAVASPQRHPRPRPLLRIMARTGRSYPAHATVLRARPAPVKNVAASVQGTAAVSATLVRVRARTAAIAGRATVSAAVVRTRTVSPAIVAAAAVSASVVRVRTRSASINSAASVSATVVRVRARSAAITGTAAVSATVVRTRA